MIRVFLRNIEAGLFLLRTVSLGLGVPAVLFGASASFVALSAIRGKTVFEDAVALAV